MTSPQIPTPPVADRREHVRAHHGHSFSDPYEWLRDKESEDVKAYLQAENEYTDAVTEHLSPLREKIFEEIKSRVKETDLSVPSRSLGWWYYSRTVEGQSYGLSCRVPATGDDADVESWTPPTVDAENPPADEQVLLDCNALAKGHDFFSLGGTALTLDGSLLAFATDTEGDERYTIYFKDLTTGEMLPDVIPQAVPSLTFSRDGQYLFYGTFDDSWRPDRVWRHRLGTDSSEDVCVFHEPDERYWTGISATRSERFLVIGVGSKVTSEAWILDADDPTGEFRCVRPREEGVEYDVDHGIVRGVRGSDGGAADTTSSDTTSADVTSSDVFFVTHNATGPNFEIGIARTEDLASTLSGLNSLAELPVLIAHDDERRLESIEAFAGHVVVEYRRDALCRVAIARLSTGDAAADATAGITTGVHEALPELGAFEEVEIDDDLFTVGSVDNPEFFTPVVRLVFSSFLTPTTVFDHVVATGEHTVRRRQEVQGGYRSEDYEQFRLWVPAADGASIPVSVVRRRTPGTPEGGPAATPEAMVLYGYGSYEASYDPAFSISRLSMLDRGVALAIAHVRGGGEMGRPWYDNGKQLSKKNTFTDFVDVARYLIGEHYTAPDRLVAEGGSAGGLLMGAVANMAPELFTGVLAIVPFVDPLTSILMPELPLTVVEWDEWGDPLHDPKVYDYMASYAPYDNVTRRDYPAILAITSLNDTRVLYVEPAKWVAKLRAEGIDPQRCPARSSDRGCVALKTEMAAGHGGVSGRYDKWKETAFELAWLVDVATASSSSS